MKFILKILIYPMQNIADDRPPRLLGGSDLCFAFDPELVLPGGVALGSLEVEPLVEVVEEAGAVVADGIGKGVSAYGRLREDDPVIPVAEGPSGGLLLFPKQGCRTAFYREFGVAL